MLTARNIGVVGSGGTTLGVIVPLSFDGTAAGNISFEVTVLDAETY